MDLNNIGTYNLPVGYENISAEDAADLDVYFKAYVDKAYRTFVELPTYDLNRQHMLLGIQSELGEIADAVKKRIAYNKPIDFVNIKEELGDLAWYIACWYRYYGYEAEINTANVQLITVLSTTDAIDTFETYHPEFAGSQKIPDLIFDIQRSFSMCLEDNESVLSMWLVLCKAFSLSVSDIKHALDLNINKLKVRYPEKFSDVLALDRNLDAEREVLEN